MSPSMEKEGIDYEVFKHIFSRAESDRDTLAKDQIHLAAFLCIPVSERLERCLGKHPEKLWVKIPNYFCLSTYVPSRTHLRHAISSPMPNSPVRTMPSIWPNWALSPVFPPPSNWWRRSLAKRSRRIPGKRSMTTPAISRWS